MIYGYARVSTTKQQADGNSLDCQRQALLDHGCTDQTIYSEAFTGTKMQRPQWNELMKVIKSGDTLIVCKLDRIARTANEGYQAISGLISKGVAVHILNMGLVDTSANGKLMLHILLAFAEFERDNIVARTQEGKNAARAKGIRVDGRPEIDHKRIDLAMQLLDQGYSYNAVADKTGISRSTLIRRNNDRKAKNL